MGHKITKFIRIQQSLGNWKEKSNQKTDNCLAVQKVILEIFPTRKIQNTIFKSKKQCCLSSKYHCLWKI